MQTSESGIEMLEAEEGVVLKAYRCPAGRWTIGAGLTAASGVVVPKAGMTITREVARTLLQRALRDGYEPAVSKAMPATRQHEFDAAVSFHFNTGAIGRATWVKRWRARAAKADIRAGLLMWNKGGGKVLPGLTARREREAELLLDARYPAHANARPQPPASEWARWGLTVSGPEIAAIRDGFRLLGYDPGSAPNAVRAEAVRQFQAAHGLTVDGIIGRATLSTLQRRNDARKGAAKTAATSAPAVAPAVVDLPPDLNWVGPVIWAGLAIYALTLAWRYRDVIAAKIDRPMPRLAAKLRSF